MVKTDRLILLVYISFIPLAILTAIFGPALVLFPEATSTYWSWEIQPAMSAVWVGSGYTFGAFAITTMLIIGKWRSSIVAIIATWPFSVVMLFATLLHLDRFFLGTINFYIWLAIYILLPVALPILWWLNRQQDPGPRVGDILLPKKISVGAGVAGVIVLFLSLLMILSPSTAAGFWPWHLTPLMSRVIGGWILFLAAALLCLVFERRYIVYKYFLPAAGIWMLLLFVASFFHFDNFRFDQPASWLWFVLIGLVSLAIFGLYLYLERYARTQGPVLQSTGPAGMPATGPGNPKPLP